MYEAINRLSFILILHIDFLLSTTMVHILLHISVGAGIHNSTTAPWLEVRLLQYSHAY